MFVNKATDKRSVSKIYKADWAHSAQYLKKQQQQQKNTYWKVDRRSK